jgi:putative serine protease PepD
LAGLRTGDVVIVADGHAIADADELIVLVRKHAPGERMTIVYLRHGVRHTAVVVLGSARSD